MNKLIILLMIAFIIPFSSAATYYISPAGSDTTGDGSNGNPWATLNKGSISMVSGDTLILKDGVYTGINNTISYQKSPPSGYSSVYTSIKAENIGRAIIDGQWNFTPVYTNVNHIIFEGLVFIRSNTSVFSIYGNPSNFSSNIKIMKCGFADSNNRYTGIVGVGNPGRANILTLRHVNNTLIEDCYAWGNGAYRFFILDSERVIVRRCVDRFDRGYGETYSLMSSFRLYGSSNCYIQNCISIDSDIPYFLTSNQSYSSGQPKLYWIGSNMGSTGRGADNNRIDGSMVLNTPTSFIGYCGNENVSNNTFGNCVFWKAMRSFWTRSPAIIDQVAFEHSLFGGIVGPVGRGLESDYTDLLKVRNSLFVSILGDALRNTNSDYSSYYNNSRNYYQDNGQTYSKGVNDLCFENSNAIDPFDGNPGNGISALKYLVKIENGSNLDGTASDGGDIGANIIKKIGVSGTLYGESGWNVVTNENLWPWPYESIIKQHFSSYYYTDGVYAINGKRGFAADGNGLYGGNITLTSYIWEYLGNPCPSDICNYTQTNQTQNQTVYHEADLNQNSYIETSEIMNYISQFKLGTVTRANVLEAVSNFFRGRYQ